jgi:hypothetical protein
MYLKTAFRACEGLKSSVSGRFCSVVIRQSVRGAYTLASGAGRWRAGGEDGSEEGSEDGSGNGGGNGGESLFTYSVDPGAENFENCLG